MAVAACKLPDGLFGQFLYHQRHALFEGREGHGLTDDTSGSRQNIFFLNAQFVGY